MTYPHWTGSNRSNAGNGYDTIRDYVLVASLRGAFYFAAIDSTWTLILLESAVAVTVT